jgi:hypothetical protein
MAEEPICFKRSNGILDIHNCRRTELGLQKTTSIFSGPMYGKKASSWNAVDRFFTQVPYDANNIGGFL